MAVAQSRGFEIYALSVDYGQRHRVELLRAERIASAAKVARHAIVKVDLRAIGGSALTADIAVPRDRPDELIAEMIPVTYVPARNTILLGLALGFAETVEAFEIFIGANALDYSGYPDCRPAFLAEFERLANAATKAAVEGRGRSRIEAPLLSMTKAEIIREGLRLGLDYSMTFSCYDPDASGRACGACDSCRLRLRGFEQAGVKDPAAYRSPDPIRQ